jgi:hypothetical protein
MIKIETISRHMAKKKEKDKTNNDKKRKNKILF